MIRAIAQVLTDAVGVAISPVPIIAIVLMLFTARARQNASAFVAGWVLALAIVSGVAYVLGDAADAATESTASDTVSWAQIAFGVGFLLLAARAWRGRPKPGDEPEFPAWMAGIESFTAVKAFGLAVLLVAVNPKNLLLSLAAGSSLAQLGVSTSEAVVSLVVFAVLSSTTIAGPYVYYLARGPRAKEQLDAAKGWLVQHNGAVMTVLFIVLGVDLVAKGLPPLGRS
jgi:threonine/homoserine/homoserine lactone efflux protein